MPVEDPGDSGWSPTRILGELLASLMPLLKEDLGKKADHAGSKGDVMPMAIVQERSWALSSHGKAYPIT